MKPIFFVFPALLLTLSSTISLAEDKAGVWPPTPQPFTPKPTTACTKQNLNKKVIVEPTSLHPGLSSICVCDGPLDSEGFGYWACETLQVF